MVIEDNERVSANPWNAASLLSLQVPDCFYYDLYRINIAIIKISNSREGL
jgi:hypothetical protein